MVPDLVYYQQVCKAGFEHFFGPLDKFSFYFLLPGYGTIENSSLINMADHFLKVSGSGKFLVDNEVPESFSAPGSRSSPLLFGVTHALLKSKKISSDKNLRIMETGGMKGKGKEMVRAELHDLLKERFGAKEVFSEYGMSELNSQSYSKGGGVFQSPPWKKVMIRDLYSPFDYLPSERSGAINIIDLANIETCCFIATDDLGRLKRDGKFEVLGRLDQSDLRGCNLLSA